MSELLFYIILKRFSLRRNRKIQVFRRFDHM
jgi:hypothetical protein